MQKFIFLSLLVILNGVEARNNLQSTQPNYQRPVVLTATADHAKTTKFSTKLLEQFHYKKVPLDDELSSEILDRYIERLDPSRTFFLAADIRAFERYRHLMDDALKNNDIRPAFGIFNIYQTRSQERITQALKILQSPLDFSEEDSIQLDRREADWPANRADAEAIWKKRVKHDYLNLLLADQDDAQIKETLSDRYSDLSKRISELDADDAYELFMNAYTSAIEPHTSYLGPRTSENFKIAMRLSLEGIGAVLRREGDYTTIQRIVAGGPADLQGTLKADDRIVSVAQGKTGESTNVVGWRLDDVVELIRGNKDTIVRLEILPNKSGLQGPSEHLSIVRDKVKLEEQAAQASVIEVENSSGVQKIGVIDLPAFYVDFAARASGTSDYRSTTRDVAVIIEELKAQNVSGIIMDLRGNGGGALDEATSVTGLFIDSGPVVQIKDSRGEIDIERDPSRGAIYNGPLAVLVDRYSASASEIMAAAIQDYGRGVIIGEPTFGKGTVQSLLPLNRYAGRETPELGQLKITMAQFFRINGGSTQNLGVTPDIAFPSLSSEDQGERAFENALPWTEIRSARFIGYGDLSNAINIADTLYKTRIKTDPEFGYLLEDIETYKDSSKNLEVTLVESKRRAERDEIKAKQEKRKTAREARKAGIIAAADAAGKPYDEDKLDNPDILLNESANILSDISFAIDQEAIAIKTAETGKKLPLIDSGSGI